MPREYVTDVLEWAEEFEDELLGALQTAGASEMMKRLVRTRIDGVRHSTLEELHKWSDDGVPTVEAAERASDLGGGFFQKVWDGDYAEAYLHADKNNQRIIEEAYDKEFIMDDARDEYTASVVDERWG